MGAPKRVYAEERETERLRREVAELRKECERLRVALAEKQLHLDDAVRRLAVAEAEAEIEPGQRVFVLEPGRDDLSRPGTVQEVERDYYRAFVLLDGQSPRETVCVPIGRIRKVVQAK